MRQQLHHSPRLWGIPRSRWRLHDLSQWCFPFLGFLTPSGVWRRLKKWKISLRRTRAHITSPDLHYRTKVAWLERVQAAAARGEVVLLYGDEHTFYRQPLEGAVWHPQGGGGQGQPCRVRYAGSDTKRRTLAALNALSGQVTWRGCARSRVPQLQHFLKQLRQAYPGQRVVLVWDNWPVHLHEKVLACASEQGIELVWLPTYAPWLNPIEKMWQWLKAEVLAVHRQSANWCQLRQEVEAFLDRFTHPAPDLLHHCGLLAD